MRLRRGAVLTCVSSVAAFAAAFAHVALVDGCGEFSVADGPSDAAPAPADAVNGGPDAAAGDADAPGDAGDAGLFVKPDAACGMHLFCADFEQPDAMAGWADLHVSGGTAAIVVGAGMPGNALRSSIPPTANQAQVWAYDVQPFPNAKGLHVELEINAPGDSLAPNGDITILEVSGEVPPYQSGVSVVLRAASPSLSFYVAKGDNNFDTPPTLADLPRDRWVYMTLDIWFGTGGSLKVQVDGKTAVDAPLTTIVPAASELRVGLQHYSEASPAFSVLYDTVRADRLK